MPKSDNLKNRLNELFSKSPDFSVPPESSAPPDLSAPPSPGSSSNAPISLSPHPRISLSPLDAFEHLAVGMLTTGLDGRIMQANPAFAAILGCTRADVEGRNFQDLTHPDDQKIGADAMRAMLEGETQAARLEKRYLHHDGHPVWIELNITLLRDPEGWPLYFMTVVQDITERKQARLLLERRAAELAAVAEVSTVATTELDPGRLLQQVVELTKEHFGLYHAQVYQVSEASDSLVLSAGAGEAGRQMSAQGWRIALDSPQSLVAQVGRSRTGLAVNDVSQEAGFLPNPLLPATRAELAVPLLAGDQLLGVLDVQSDQVGRFSPEDVHILETLAAQVAVALQNARQYAALRRSEAMVRLIIDATPDWVFVKDLHHRMVLVNTSMAHAMHRTVEEMFGKDDLELGFPPEYVLGDPERGIRGYWEDDDLVMRQGQEQTIHAEENEVDGVLHYFDVYKTPMRSASGQITGLLGYARDVTERERLLQAAERQAQEMAILNEMGRVLSASLDQQHILDTIYIYTGRLMDAGSLFVALYDAVAGLVSFPLAFNNGERVDLPTRPLHPRAGGMTDYILRTCAPLLFSDDVPGSMQSIGLELITYGDEQPAQSWLGVPLLYGERVLGVISVQSTRFPGLYTGRDKELLSAVAAQAANALMLAEQFRQTQVLLAQAQSLNTGSARLVSARSLDEVVQALAEATVLGSLDQVAIRLFDRPWTGSIPSVMIDAAVWDRCGNTLDPAGAAHALEEFPFLHLLEREAPLVVEDMLLDPRLDEKARFLSAGLRSLVFWPLIAGGEWFGLLAAHSHDPLRLSPGDVHGAGSLVGQASVVIQGIRLQDGMRQRVQELTNLQRLMSREAWLSYQASTPADSGALDRLGGTRPTPASGYLFDRVALTPLPSGSDLSMDLAVADPVGAIPVGANLGVRPTPGATIAAPLQVRGEPIGVLGVALDPGRSLTREEEAFLQAVSEQVAQALERARLMEQTHKSAVELQAVAEVSTTTATILDPQELLQTVVDLTRDRFGLYHAHIYLLDETGENLVLAVGAGQVGKAMTAEGWYIPLEQPDSLVAWVARQRRGKIIADVRTESGYLVNSLLPDTLSELAVPMLCAGPAPANRLLGVFDVQASTANRFTEEDIRTYNTLAAQIAVALQNAQLYAEQLATVERLRELDNMKSAFLANMSHELRTPLNSILGFTQVIVEGLDGPLTDVMVSDLELIEKNGKHLLSLINDVLDMAKIEAGRLTLTPEPVNLYDMMDEVILTNAALARDKNLFVNLDADPAGDWVVMADHVRIRQILINLMGNSIKFTETGGITITLARTTAGGEGVASNVLSAQGVLLTPDRIQVRIRDTGIGIPVGKLEDIFEAFSQVDSSTTRKAGGTGLGLPISRRLVELHGGRLWAESPGPGRGATFIMELPVGTLTDPSPEPTGAERHFAPGTAPSPVGADQRIRPAAE